MSTSTTLGLVTIFNHGGDAIPTELIVAIAKDFSPSAHEVAALEELSGDIGFAHATNEEWETIKGGAKSGQIRIRMATHGLPSSPEPQRQDSGAYFFNLVSEPDQLSDNDWRAMFRGFTTKATAPALATGGNPSGLRRFFFRSKIEILSALAILCQGYLAVHGAYEGAQDWQLDDIDQALRQMGWYEAKTDKLFANVDIELAKPSVRSSKWWLEIWNGSMAQPQEITDFDLRDSVKIEWQELKGGPLDERVESLLSTLAAGSEVTPKVVANCYLAIAEALHAPRNA